MSLEPLYAEVYTDGERLYLPLSEIEHRVAIGQIGLDAQLDCPSLVGDTPKPLWTVERFVEAANTPEARMMAHLRSSPTPFVSIGLLFLLLCAGILQQRGWLPLSEFAFGWSGIVLHHHWWSVWTYWLPHLDWMHWVGNVALTYFCARRIERMVGSHSLALYASILLLGSAVGIYFWENGLVMGASVLVFGLWTMMVGLGFRFADSLPPRLQSHYGWSNFMLFLPVLVLNVLSHDVSHVAHWTAIVLGGVLSVRCIPTTTQEIPQFRNTLLMTVILHALVGGFFYNLSTKSPTMSKPFRTDAGFHLSLPERFIQQTWCESPAWQTEGVRLYSSGVWMDSDMQQESTPSKVISSLYACGLNQVTCRSVNQQPITLVANLDVMSDHWEVVTCKGDQNSMEYVLERGSLFLRVGCQYEDDQAKAFCEHWLWTVKLGETTQEQSLFQEWKSQDQRGRETLQYAESLLRFGRLQDADRLLANMETRFDAFKWRGTEQRLSLHLSSDVEWIGEQDWLTHISQSIPVDEIMVLEKVLRLSKSRGWCDITAQTWVRWRKMMPTGLDELETLVNQCSGD